MFRSGQLEHGGLLQLGYNTILDDSSDSEHPSKAIQPGASKMRTAWAWTLTGHNGPLSRPLKAPSTVFCELRIWFLRTRLVASRQIYGLWGFRYAPKRLRRLCKFERSWSQICGHNHKKSQYFDSSTRNLSSFNLNDNYVDTCRIYNRLQKELKCLKQSVV